ncbi:MAG: Gfo/Idh/MocA family oxidoreductase [Lentisphaeria bacterium]|nr:Gfo/Idh/MocA family oxidoreductase [Lentisphaeria bacterium]
MIHVALVGAAHIHTPGFVKKLQARGEIVVKRVYDHDEGRGQASAAALDATFTADLATIWTDPEITAVVICSETDRHEPLVLAAAAAGKHMFVEKPLGMGAADAYSMADAIEKSKVLFQTGYFRRGTPIEIFLKQQVEAGAFGMITRVRHTNCHSGSLGGWFDTDWRWMADPKQAGCGAFGDLGTHSLDILLWWMGAVTRVTADLDPGTSRYGDCDEFGEALMRFECGAIGSMAAGWVDVAHPGGIVISGTEGHAHVDAGALFFKSTLVEGADGVEPWKSLPDMEPHAFDLFLDALLGKKVTLIGAREAAYRSAVMEAMYRAAEAQTWEVPVTA